MDEEEEEGEDEEEEEKEDSSQRVERAAVSEERRAPPTTTTTAAAAMEQAGEENLPQQMSSDELRIRGENREEPDQLEQQDPDSQGSTGRPQEPSPRYSTLPLPKKPGHGVGPKQGSASDLETSSAPPRYNTLSYRKIQRGNTRQKIKEFEFMGMKL